MKEGSSCVAAFEESKKRPGNRSMATVASVYTVVRFCKFRPKRNCTCCPPNARSSIKEDTVLLETGEKVFGDGL